MSPIARHTSHIHDPQRGIILKIASVLMFSCMSACVKLLGHEYPTGQIIFARSFFALFPLLPLVYMAGIATLATKRPKGHLLRGLVGLTAMTVSFYALPHLQLATFTSIIFTMPLFVALLAALVLKEKLTRPSLVMLVIGFAGTLLVLRPEAGLIDYYALMALLSSFLVAIVTVVIRQLTATENSLAIVIWFTLLSTVLSGVATLFSYTVPDWRDGWLLVGSGIFGGIGQVLLTQAYRYGQVSMLTALEYTGVLWAGLFGWLFWREVPDFLTIIGTAIIIISGVYILSHASRAQKRAALSSAQSKTC